MTNRADDRAAIITRRLEQAGCVAADEETAELLAAARDDDTLECWVRRREGGEPLAWITGVITFSGHTIAVEPGVYVPRLQTEMLAQRAAMQLAKSSGGRRAADLCTGAGAVAVHLKASVPDAAVIGVDIDARAVMCARRNGVRTVRGDVDRPLRGRSFDVVTAVPPYVPTGALGVLPADVQRYEPVAALDGGDDGLDVARRIVAGAARLLRPGGWLLLEVGGDQDEALGPALATHGFTNVAAWADEDGDLRGMEAQATQPF